MGKVKNILWIMADQLRWDYLSCTGHRYLQTPNIDRIAELGVRFDRAYVQAPVCGPSRMSFYTGRTVFSHGATWNFVPLPVGEFTLGDYLRPHDTRVALVGKTHIHGDDEGMARLGLSRESELGTLIWEGGFEPFERDDGEHPTPKVDPKLRYNTWLRSLGYDGANPWNDWANAADGPDGEILSGWHMRNANLPARVAEEHSETAYMTDRGLDFLADAGDRPWLLHLSYIKPHWPYIAPAPYHAVYGNSVIPDAVRSPGEKVDPHPVYDAFMKMDVSQAFSRDEVRQTVIPAYMGLIKQIDDHLGRVFAHLERSGLMDNTAIVVSSDHGDHLGDHWLGEKELFYESGIRVPLIFYDPDPAADATRGTVSQALAEAIDLVPTFLEMRDVPLPTHRLEGRSLLPLIRSDGSTPNGWRESVFCELDYAFYRARLSLDVGPNDARSYMLRTDRWKFIHHRGFSPQLFDIRNDPDEFEDLGRSAQHEPIRRELNALLLDRLTSRRNRVAMPDQTVIERTDGAKKVGTLIGVW